MKTTENLKRHAFNVRTFNTFNTWTPPPLGGINQASCSRAPPFRKFQVRQKDSPLTKKSLFVYFTFTFSHLQAQKAKTIIQWIAIKCTPFLRDICKTNNEQNYIKHKTHCLILWIESSIPHFITYTILISGETSMSLTLSTMMFSRFPLNR